jgi:ribonuclease HI
MTPTILGGHHRIRATGTASFEVLVSPPLPSLIGAGALLLTPDGKQFKYMMHLEFKATNNMSEYEALIFGLSTALSLEVRQLLVKGDSQLITK